MADHGDLVVARDTALGDEYLCTWIGAFNTGHRPSALPVVQVLRMLRFPVQHAIAPGWEDVPSPNPPLRYLDLCRMRVIRTACLADRVMLTFFRDYAASVRSCAFEAMAFSSSPAERRLIALTLAGFPGQRRSTFVLSRVEIQDLREGGWLPCDWKT